MDGEVQPPTRILVFAWTTALLGSIDVLRLIAESIALFGRLGSEYHAAVGVDVVVGSLGVLSGVALLKNRPWPWEPCAVFWGAGSAISAVMLWAVIPDFLRCWASGFRRDDLIMLPRLIYYVITAAASPFAIGILLAPSSAERPSTRTMAMWLGLGAIVGALFIRMIVLTKAS